MRDNKNKEFLLPNHIILPQIFTGKKETMRHFSIPDAFSRLPKPDLFIIKKFNNKIKQLIEILTTLTVKKLLTNTFALI